jgi:hypothetical protein
MALYCGERWLPILGAANGLAIVVRHCEQSRPQLRTGGEAAMLSASGRSRVHFPIGLRVRPVTNSPRLRVSDKITSSHRCLVTVTHHDEPLSQAPTARAGVEWTHAP